jgi:hypothetical protein
MQRDRGALAQDREACYRPDDRFEGFSTLAVRCVEQALAVQVENVEEDKAEMAVCGC